MTGELEVVVRWGHGNVFRRYDRIREKCGGGAGLCAHCQVDDLYRHLLESDEFSSVEVRLEEIGNMTARPVGSRPFWYDYNEPLQDPVCLRRLEACGMLQYGVRHRRLPLLRDRDQTQV